MYFAIIYNLVDDPKKLVFDLRYSQTPEKSLITKTYEQDIIDTFIF